MAKFVYSMENILKVKYKVKDQAETAFTVAQHKVDEAREELAVLNARQLGYEQEKRKLMMDRLDVRRLGECETSIKTIKFYIEKQKKKIAALEAVLDNARKKLQEAMIDCKTHEKLKENEFQVFLQELNEQEKKEIDEVVSYQYNKPKEG